MIISPEAHALFADQLLLTLMNSWVKSGMITADQARTLIDMTVRNQSSNNPPFAAEFQEIGRQYREGLEHMVSGS